VVKLEYQGGKLLILLLFFSPAMPGGGNIRAHTALNRSGLKRLEIFQTGFDSWQRPSKAWEW
jgi:hypothetical protein